MTTTRICSVSDCGRPHAGRGFCQKHWKRFRNHGDPLVVSGTERGKVKEFYENVVLPYKGDECLIWPYSRNESGYGTISIDRKMFIVSRIVCVSANGAPPTPKHEAAHCCGNGSQGCVTQNHLSWKTPVENQADRLLHGTHNRGDRSGHAKLTETQAREILSLRGKELQRETAKRFGVSGDTVSGIQRGSSWRHLSTQPNQ